MTALAAPPTRCARSGEARIAFQVIGDGPPDVVVVGGRASHLELQWERIRGRRACAGASQFEHVLAWRSIVERSRRRSGTTGL
jgi:hypothetical protein